MGGSSSKSVTTASPYAPWLGSHLQQLVSNAAGYAYGGRGGESFDYHESEEGGGRNADGSRRTNADKFAERVAPRFADLDPYQTAAHQAAQGLYDRGDQYGQQSLGAANQAMGGLANMQTIQSNYNPTDFQGGQFDQAAVDQYMNPYMQTVVDAQKRAAREEFSKQQNKTMAGKVAHGAMGGYRDTVGRMVAETENAKAIADIQGEGSSAAYLDARKAFDLDRNARLEAEGMSDMSRFRGSEQQFNVGKENMANILKQAKARSDMSSLYSNLDRDTQDRAYKRLDMFSAAGLQRYKLEQAKKDLAFDEYMREFNYPQEQMSWLSGIMSGVPTQANAYVRTPGPSGLQSGIGAATALGGAALAARGVA